MEKKIRRLLIVILLLIVFLLTLIVDFSGPSSLILNFLSGNTVELFFTMITAAISIVGAGAVMFRSLEGRGDENKESAKEERNELQKLREEYKNLVQELSNKDKDAIVDQLHQQVKKATTEDFLGELRESLTIRLWQEYLAETSQRINKEIAAQGRRGNLNMVLGFLSAVVGVTVLFYIVITETQNEATSMSEFLMTFIPRISMVAIIELFAYFFLRLYKASLSEIKYFQNEATNIELKFIALRVALERGEPALIKQVISTFLQVERNPLLDREKTTLELEKERLDQNAVTISLPLSLSALKDLLSKEDAKEKQSSQSQQVQV